ncbi:MAG TPA: DUF711 family protein [Nevskiaceae bacterium]
MKIRAFTVGVPLFGAPAPTFVEPLKRFREAVRRQCAAVGVQPLQLRLTLPPLPRIDPPPLKDVAARAHQLATSAEIACYCLPVDLTGEPPAAAVMEALPELLLSDPLMFLNLMVADKERIAAGNVDAASRVVLEVARHSGNRGENFRMGVSAACGPGTPYFPFSRHAGDAPAFSIASVPTPEVLALARRARQEQWTLDAFRDRLVDLLAEQMRAIDALGRKVAEESDVAYLGLDSSYAPVPSGGASVGDVLEALGPRPAGAPGSVFITSVLTDALRAAAHRARVPTVGFNGVMYALTEDHGLAKANDDGAFSLEKFALLSAVCGCGVDMIPVPGDMASTDLGGLILDVATLAVRIGKPLGVRVLPVPGMVAGDMTKLEVDMLSPTRVVGPGASDASAPLPCAMWRYLRPPRSA